MSSSCFRSVEPNISSVDLLYDGNSDEDSMYSGSGVPPPCSSFTAPPPASGCVVCFQRFVYAVCSDLLKNVTLVMEGGGLPIDLVKSECPIFSAQKEMADLSGDDMGASKWWWLLLPLLLLLVAVIIMLKYGCRGVWRAVDSNEVNPDAESPV